MGLPLRQPETVRSPDFLEWFRGLGADAGALVAYGEILPRALLAIPEKGFVNLHFSLLPHHRGAAPVQWAIASGDTVTGVTTQRVVPRLDAGDILIQRQTAIGPREKASELGPRLAALGAPMLVETFDRLEAGTVEPRAQDEALATSAPLLRREDGLVDWQRRAETIAQRIRGFDPWPGCGSSVRGCAVRLLDAVAEARIAGETAENVEAGGRLPAGTVLGLAEGALRIVSGEGTVLRVERLQFPGGKPLTGQEAVTGGLGAGGYVLGAGACAAGGDDGAASEEPPRSRRGSRWAGS
jgi:methionyl-tRNA formyltransferase